MQNKKLTLKIYIEKTMHSNAIWAIILLLLRTIINFVLAPYITNKAGIEAYGYIALASNMVMYIDIICIAFNYFAGRNISICIHKGNIEKAKSYYSTILTADIVLCILICIPSVFIISFIDHIIIISKPLVIDVKILFMFVLLKYFVSMIGSTLEVAAFIKNRLDISYKNNIVSYITYAIFLILFFNYSSPHIWYVGCSALIQSTVYLLLQYIAKCKLVKVLEFHLSLFSYSKIKMLVSHGVWISFNNLGNILNDGLDLLITNLMITEVMMSMISIAKMIGNICYSVVGAVSNSMRPKQLKLYSDKDKSNLVSELCRSMRITGCIFGFCLSGIIGCGKDFLTIWMRGQDTTTIFYLTTIAVLCFLVPSVVNPLYYVYVLTRKVKFASFITISMGIVNVLSMYFLINYTTLGGYAVLLTTAAVNLTHLFDAPLYAAYCLKVSWKSFYNPIINHVILCVLCSTVCHFYSIVTPLADTWLFLIVKGIGCFVIICICFALFYGVKYYLKQDDLIHIYQDDYM